MPINEDNTHLYNGFYIADVVDNKDDLNSQRVKVRVLGLHTQNKDGELGDKIPDSDLPWANKCDLLKGTNIPKIGDKVYIFFLNGNHNQPVYLGIVKKASDTLPEVDDIRKIGNSRDDKTFEINHGDLQIKTAKTIHGSKVEIRNTESNGFIKMDTFDGKSRILLSADTIEIDGETNMGKGVKGYPVISESKQSNIAIGGVRLRTSNSGVA